MKIALIIFGIIPVVISLVFTVYACLNVGARADKNEEADNEQ